MQRLHTSFLHNEKPQANPGVFLYSRTEISINGRMGSIIWFVVTRWSDKRNSGNYERKAYEYNADRPWVSLKRI